MTNPHRSECPVANMLNIFGDRWTWLLVRESFYGARRFSEFERNTGIAKNLLADRLNLLVETDIFEKRNIAQHGNRYAYHLTEKGKSLVTVLVAMFQWGSNNFFADDAAPIELVERASGLPVKTMTVQSQDGLALSLSDLSARPTPAASKATAQRLLGIGHPPNKQAN